MFAVETEDVLQAWALPIENIIGVDGFVLALTANPLTSGGGREGSSGCSASSVPPEWFRLSLIEDISEIKIEDGVGLLHARAVRARTVESVRSQSGCAPGSLQKELADATAVQNARGYLSLEGLLYYVCPTTARLRHVIASRFIAIIAMVEGAA